MDERNHEEELSRLLAELGETLGRRERVLEGMKRTRTQARLHEITVEAVSGGVPERRAWLKDSGHFQVGNLARMTPEQRETLLNEMLGDH
jgi:hypothetical protein